MFEVNLEVTKVVVMVLDGTDKVYLYTTLPSSYLKEVGDEPLQLSFEATKGTGIDYVRAVFAIEPEVLNIQEMRKEAEAKAQELPHGADKWDEVQSSNISNIGLKGSDLLIRFKNGATYRYPGKAKYYVYLMESDSKGKAFFRIKAALTEHEKL